MKRILLSMALAILSLTSYSQDIFGKWLIESGDGHVEIYQSGDKVNGKIIWLQQGADTKDKHNPDAALQSRKLVGVNILSGLSKKKDRWEGGTIYDPKTGKTYKCAIWMDGKNLKVRGYLGIFHETQTWKRLP